VGTDPVRTSGHYGMADLAQRPRISLDTPPRAEPDGYSLCKNRV